MALQALRSRTSDSADAQELAKNRVLLQELMDKHDQLRRVKRELRRYECRVTRYKNHVVANMEEYNMLYYTFLRARRTLCLMNLSPNDEQLCTEVEMQTLPFEGAHGQPNAV